MVARGEVRLDQRLAEILPEGWTMDPSAAEVTIEQVITHRSGLPTAWPGFVPASIADPFDNLTEQVLREGLARAAVVAPPGSAHAYNNFAVSVLGLSLANRLHMPFEAALEARVLGPLGLRNTWMDVPPREAGLAPCGCDGLDRRACAPLAPSRRVSRRRSAGECA
jgi:CubicO group peptidase (beta-lactamase class C family)